MLVEIWKIPKCRRLKSLWEILWFLDFCTLIIFTSDRHFPILLKHLSSQMCHRLLLKGSLERRRDFWKNRLSCKGQWRQGSGSTHLRVRKKKGKHFWLPVTLSLASDTAFDPQAAQGWLSLFKLCWRPRTEQMQQPQSRRTFYRGHSHQTALSLANPSRNNFLLLTLEYMLEYMWVYLSLSFNFMNE